MSTEATSGPAPAEPTAQTREAEAREAEPAGTAAAGVLATWRQVPGAAKALLAGVFVNRLAGFLQIFLVLFLTHRGFSAERAGFALGLYGAGAVVGTFAGGALSDRVSTRTTTLISMAGSAALIVSIVYLPSYYMVLGAVLLVSAVGQLYRPAAQALITELTPPDRLVMVTAMYRLSLNLGTTAAPLLGVALVSVSYDLLFWGEAIAALLFGLIALRVFPPRPPAVAEAAATASSTGYRAVLADRRFLLFLLGFLLFCLVYSQYTAALPLAVVRAGLSVWWYGTAVTVNALIVVTCEVWATRYVQNWPPRRALTGGFVLLAAGYACYSIHMVPALLLLGTLTWTLAEVVGAPSTYAYPGLVAPAELRGRYYGAMQSTYGLAGTIGPILGVLLFDHIGQRMFLVAALTALAATAVVRLGVTTPPTPAPARFH